MKTKFTMFRRGEMFYMQDSATGKQTSLHTKDETEAKSLLEARNAAQRQPVLNLHLARAYLTASDPAFVERTWQVVMEQMQSRGNPLVLIAVFGVLTVIAILAMPGNEAARPVDLLIFAGLGFFSGIAQRIHRWREMERNVRQHSYYIGTSPFEQRWVSAFFRRHRRTARIIDPLVCAAIGLALLPFSRALALWLIFSAFCLRAYEDGIFNRERTQELDISDGLIESKIQGDNVEHFSDPTDPGQNPPAEAGVPTGIADDIHEHIKRRQKK